MSSEHNHLQSANAADAPARPSDPARDPAAAAPRITGMDGPPRALIVPRRRRRGLKLLRWGLISLIVVLAAVAVVVAIAGHHGASVRATRSDQKQPSTASKAGAAPVPRTVPGVGVQPLGITGTWKLVFHDDFNGNSLNTRAWNTNNGHAGLNDITAHASNVSVS
jgi:hypothetical protein